MADKIKELGQIFTPNRVVKQILTEIEYNNKNIIGKYLFEPSFGDGAFLEEIVSTYVKICLEEGLDTPTIIEHLNEYICGVEIDNSLFNKTINKLNKLIHFLLGVHIEWNGLKCDNILNYPININKRKFDYVVGNPPYVSIHNIKPELKETIKNNNITFFEKSGNLFIVFFEIGIELLNDNGVLGYITPNSYLFNQSFSRFRKYLKKEKLINKIIDFKSEKIFENVSAYTAITIIRKDVVNNNIIYQTSEETKIIPISQLNVSLGGFVEEINHVDTIGDYFNVQYGLATLADNIFIDVSVDFNDIEVDEDKVMFNGSLIEKDILKPITKASKYYGTFKSAYIIFPYEKMLGDKYVLISDDYFEETYPLAWEYLNKHKERLSNRSLEKNSKWYGYGRSQGIHMIDKEKYCVSTIIKSGVELHFTPKNSLIYSGLSITKKHENVEWDILLKTIINNDEFHTYLKDNSKPLSGGYSNINSKLIKNYPIKS